MKKCMLRAQDPKNAMAYHIVLVDFDNRSRERKILVQVSGS